MAERLNAYRLPRRDINQELLIQPRPPRPACARAMRFSDVERSPWRPRS